MASQDFIRAKDVERFYAILGELARRVNGPRTLSACDASSGWPERGVYFFFEEGEVREDGISPRVVRVGTHALRPAKSTLWGRLSQHRGSIAGSMPGGGNHRGSVFRQHVGSAMLRAGSWPSPIGESWSNGSTASREVRLVEYPLERAVSKYIGSMQVLWLAVNDPASGSSDRGVIERGTIGLLSNISKKPIDGASRRWLGLHSKSHSIRDSGLWNVEYSAEKNNLHFLDVLEKWVSRAV